MVTSWQKSAPQKRFAQTTKLCKIMVSFAELFPPWKSRTTSSYFIIIGLWFGLKFIKSKILFALFHKSTFFEIQYNIQILIQPAVSNACMCKSMNKFYQPIINGHEYSKSLRIQQTEISCENCQNSMQLTMQGNESHLVGSPKPLKLFIGHYSLIASYKRAENNYYAIEAKCQFGVI